MSPPDEAAGPGPRSPFVPMAVLVTVLSLISPVLLVIGLALGGNPVGYLATDLPRGTGDAWTTGGLVAGVFLSGPTFIIAMITHIRYHEVDPRTKLLPALALGGLLLIALIVIGVYVIG